MTAEQRLEALVLALDRAFISTWQSTAAWQKELDDARLYLLQPKAVASPVSGVSLRDYFAGQALQGELAVQSEESGFWAEFERLTAKAYEIADSMLEARKC